MKITFQDEAYYVRWQHTRYDGRPMTYCSIWVGNGRMIKPRSIDTQPEFDGSPKACDHAHCGKRDQFNRKIGRAVSLGRAAKQLFPERKIRHLFIRAVQAKLNRGAA